MLDSPLLSNALEATPTNDLTSSALEGGYILQR